MRVHAAKGETAADPNAPLGPNKSAADAVNNGLACFEKRRYEAAVRNFSAALKDFRIAERGRVPSGAVQPRVRLRQTAKVRRG